MISAVASGSHAALVAHFNFDNSGDLGANTGTVSTGWNQFSGVAQTAGRFGTGSGSFVAGVSQSWDADFTVGNLDRFSLSMHVKTSQTTDWVDFVSIGIGGTVFIFEQTSTDGVGLFNIGNVGGASSGGLFGSPVGGINNGAWHQLGITVGSGTLTLFLDGVSQGSTAYAGSGAIDSFQLASRFADNTRVMTTEIDDVAIYDTTLSSAQMTWLSSNAAIANPVPEPSAMMIGSIGLLGLLRRRR